MFGRGLVSRSLIVLSLLAAVHSGFLTSVAPLGAADVIVIRGGTIVPAPGRRIENGVVVIRDGRIEAVGAELETPPGAEVVDASGLTIYAGFIDAATSVGLDDVKRPAGPSLSRLVDTRRSAAAQTEPTYRKGTAPEIRAADYFELDAKGGEPHREAGFTAALVAPPSDIFAGQSALVSLAGAPRREAIITSPIAMHGAFSSRGRGYPSTLMGCMAHFRQVLLDARRLGEQEKFHAEHPDKARRPAYDPTLTALRPVLEREMPMVLRASSELGIRRAIGMAEEFGLRVALDGGRDAWKVAPTLASAKIPVMVALDFDEEPKVDDEEKTAEDSEVSGESEASDDSESGEGDDANPKDEEEPKSWAELPGEERFAVPLRVRQDRHRLWAEKVDNARVLAERGVDFVFATQGKPKPFMKDLATAVERGLSHDAALRALTTEPARLFGVEAMLGTVEAGKAAHLTILNGELGDEKSSVAYVVIDGEKFEVEGKKEASSEEETEGLEGPASLPGTWKVAVTSERGEREMTWKIAPSGRKFTGTLESQFGEMELARASLSGNEVEIDFRTEFDGNEFTLEFRGSMAGDEGRGTMSSRMGEATWTAKRTSKPKADLKGEVR